MKYSFKVSCTKNKLRLIRDFIGKTLQKHDLPEIEINMLVLAVDEVCANLMIHSHGCNPDDFIELKVKVQDKQSVTFDIVDKGEGFNILKYSEPTLTEIVKNKKKGGMGLMLVRRIMDDIEFRPSKNYNTYRLYKKIEA